MRGILQGGELGQNGKIWEIAAVLGLCPVLLAVALWNGFPITFYDTGAYLAQGLNGQFFVERAPVYSLFLRLAGAGWSLWCVVAVQALMTGFVLVQVMRMAALPLWAMFAIGAGLVAVTGLPFYAGQLVPDSFAAVAVLSAWLLGFHAGRLGRWRVGLLLLIATLATASHSSHLGLMAGLALFLLLLRLFAPKHWPRANPALPALCFALAVTAIFAVNFALTREVFLNRAGPNFVFGRLLQDGIVNKLLDEDCPQAGYVLCAYKDTLPRSADIWLWGKESPFLSLGGFDGTRAESAHIIGESLKRYPWLHLETALRAGAAQFVTFRTGDQIEPQQWILYPDFHRLIPAQLPAYLEARQQQNGFDFRAINAVHVPVAWAGLAGLCALLLWYALRRDRRLVFALFVLVALGGNALICGALSNPHDRYQSRLIWLPLLALAVAAPLPKKA